MVDTALIVALDFRDSASALALLDKLDPHKCRVKIGKELFTRCGPELIKRVQQQGFEVFLDLKFHDIPHTVAQACVAAADLGVWMVNVHASGGPQMMTAARNALEPFGRDAPWLTAVTVLTSFDRSQLQAIGLDLEPLPQVQRLAQLAQDSGMDGVVCSAQEAQILRAQLRSDFVLVTPGIRPSWAAADDQKRIMTPAEALRAGVNYLVIGRPISQAADPAQSLGAIYQEMMD